MPMHDWTRVSAGDFHDFRQCWTVSIRTRLNAGILPAGFYAQVERVSGQAVPDVLTLHERQVPSDNPAEFEGAIALAVAPPEVAVTSAIESLAYAKRKNRVAVKHEGSGRVVAMIEVVSSGNKANERDFRQFVNRHGQLGDAGFQPAVERRSDDRPSAMAGAEEHAVVVAVAIEGHGLSGPLDRPALMHRLGDHSKRGDRSDWSFLGRGDRDQYLVADVGIRIELEVGGRQVTHA